MIKINLLPSESIKKEERQELMLIAYLVVIVLIAVGIIRYGIKYKAFKQTENDIKKVEMEFNKYESIVRQVEALQATKTALENKKNIINSLMAFRLIYPYFYETLMETLPDNVWFKTLDTKLDSSGMMTVNISAESLDNYSISDFVTTLTSNNSFSNVQLGPVSTTRSEKSSFSTFKVTFNYKKVIKP